MPPGLALVLDAGAKAPRHSPFTCLISEEIAALQWALTCSERQPPGAHYTNEGGRQEWSGSAGYSLGAKGSLGWGQEASGTGKWQLLEMV